MFQQIFDLIPPLYIDEQESAAWRAEFMEIFSKATSFTFWATPGQRYVLQFSFDTVPLAALKSGPVVTKEFFLRALAFMEEWKRRHRMAFVEDPRVHLKAAQLLAMGQYWNMVPFKVSPYFEPSLGGMIQFELFGPNVRPNAP